ncbi:PREDICTED: putative F-box/LRR-repeat/kelch-repeat protein At1g11620 [Camelina sativa]|uniref:F-box/LRR-repeat/kelch-repeat protein At1g11620 n=1 Tax=Camelina sativa TaxID=90675 RepID=A0ABM0X4C6_CAMSA|nr:PREDICTED: putative F-box/LRR-repeat/kelch-repeat protein At1g11620 [Camelina sativa]
MELASDMIEEILSWVPSKSLLRLKTTCKQWETLITEPRFIKKHLSNMRGRVQQFIVLNHNCKTEVAYWTSTLSCVGIYLDELESPCLNLQVLQRISTPNFLVQNMYHCDGLLLFVMRSNLLVLNPTLKQARWITCGYRIKDLSGYGLGCISSNQSLGHSDYRIVRFLCGPCDVGKSRIEVYEFKSDSWRVVVDQSFEGFFNLPESSVSLRGTPYWLGYLNGKPFTTIQSFDFSKERFESLFLPPSCIESKKLDNSLSLGVFRGDRFSLLHKCRDTNKLHLWVMKKHWSKLMTVSPPEFYMCPKFSSHFVEKNGKLVLSVRGLGYMSIYIVGKNQELQKVKCSSIDPSTGGSCCYYVPSLLPVPG